MGFKGPNQHDIDADALGNPSGASKISPSPAALFASQKVGSKGWRLAMSRILFSSLFTRIIFLNLAGLIVLVSGILFLNQFRDSLIEARVESLLTQGEIISGAIAARATVETDAITIDPDKLLELQAGESAFPMRNESDNLDFPINPEQVAPILRRLISPTRTRARIYDRDGLIILDSLRLYSRGQILRYELPPLSDNDEGTLANFWARAKSWALSSDHPIYRETPDGNGTAYKEVVSALTGSSASKTRVTVDGDTIVSVAVPVQRFRAVLGVLLLSTEAGDIDKIIRAERFAILRTFVVAAVVTFLLSLLLTRTIARPLQKLSAAAERVRVGEKTREEIPDFSYRHDEIGQLSTSLRDMTNALYGRIEAIESFAADVSHELKNPLTSLRSAVETLPLVKNDGQRKQLLDIIEHDVRRLDRLISDISDASRLDAELAREDTTPVDLENLLQRFHDTYTNMGENTKSHMPKLTLKITKPTGKSKAGQSWLITGHQGRLGQVMANLIENARSFVPKKSGRIDLALTRKGNNAVITVTDNGPGIDPENTERVFERFYTDRPAHEEFGQNSGLGLSITKQIVDAHKGTITVDNVVNAKTGKREGAVFTVTIPLANARAPK